LSLPICFQYPRIIQFYKAPDKRENKGLEYVFRTSFPFKDPNDNIAVEYLGYEIGDWECNKCDYKPDASFLGGYGVKCPKCGGTLIYKEKYTPEECKAKGLTYSAPLRVMFRLRVKTKKGERVTEPKKVYFGEIPMMTETGSFIINGSERVIVNQLIRSSGVFFEEKEERQKDSTIVRIMYRASIIPDKGSRVEFELSGATDIFSARVDRKKLSGTLLLRAFGLEDAYDILSPFYDGVRRLKVEDGLIVDEQTREEFTIEDLEAYHIFAILRYKAIIEGKDQEGEFIEERYIEEPESLERLIKDERINIERITVVPKESVVKSKYSKIVLDTLINETTPREPYKKSLIKIPSKFTLRDVGLVEVYKRLRLIETMAMEIEHLVERARSYFKVFFENITRYDLSKVGRYRY